jgi:glutathione S-transferase
MKLYYSPGACSLSPHIVANELGLNVELVKVNLKNHTLENGKDFFKINPKGYVPVLEIEEGEILTEGPAIVQYMGDQNSKAEIVPRPSTLERYHLQEMLGYVNSEIHKTYSMLFNPEIKPEVAKERKEYLKKRYTYLNDVLKDREFLMGDHFTAVDAYLFTVTNWAPKLNIDLSPFTNILNFQKRIGERPAVQRALKEEGLT